MTHGKNTMRYILNRICFLASIAFLITAVALIMTETILDIFVDMEYVVAFFLYAFILGVVAAITSTRKAKPTSYPSCTNCGYNLTGNVSGICPECGTPIETE